jgi:hypothetical protein
VNQRRKPGILIYLFALSGFAAVIAAACSSNSPAASTGGTCSLAGNRCQFGCSDSQGCVECLANTDCPNGAPLCVSGLCVACGTTADCNTGQVCEPATHTCANPCTTNANCVGGGGPGGGDAPTCDVATGTCIGCTVANQATACASPRTLCDPNRMQCSVCLTSANCGPATPACDTQTGNCVECLVDANCTGKFACGADHQCHPICTANTDCATTPARPICDSVGACVECASNTDCATNANNLHICNLDNHTCAACVANTDCAATPNTPVCRRGGGGGGFGGAQCVQCAANTDCAAMAATPICDVANGQCVQCRTNANCAATPATPNCTNGTCGA